MFKKYVVNHFLLKCISFDVILWYNTILAGTSISELLLQMKYQINTCVLIKYLPDRGSL